MGPPQTQLGGSIYKYEEKVRESEREKKEEKGNLGFFVFLCFSSSGEV